MRDRPLALLLDDDLVFRKSLETVLTRMGLDVQATSDSKEFLKLSRATKPDLHLIDLRLGDVDGFEVLKALRAAEPNAIIVVISGVQGQFALLHALERGANDFIMKPLDRALLATKLSRYIQTPDLAEQGSKLVELPEGRAPGRLDFELELTHVDELGIGLVSPHLLAKGTALRLRSEFFKRIGASEADLLFTVVSTSFDPTANLYGAYAEPVDPSPEYSDALRRWLVQTQRKSASQKS